MGEQHGELRVDRSHFSVTDLDAPTDDAEYWQTKSPAERMQALEYLRRMAYGDRATQRLQRVFEIVDLDDLTDECSREEEDEMRDGH